MATNRFITQLASGLEQVVTAISTSLGVGDANKIVATNASGVIDSSLLPPGVGQDTATIASSEDLPAGRFVNIWDDTGITKVRLADASNGRAANGFVLDAVTSPANATVYRIGINTGLTGLTGGTKYFLGTAGAVTPTPDTTSSGYIIQFLGTAQSSSAIAFVENKVTSIA